MRVTLDEVVYRLLPRVEAGRALADVEWTTLVRAAETLLEGGPMRMPPSAVADNVEAFLCRGRSRHAWRIRVLLTLVEYGPWLVAQGRFSHLQKKERREFVDRHWLTGSGVFGLCARTRLLAIMGCYGDERSFRETGFVPLRMRARFARGAQRPFGNHPAATAKAQEGRVPQTRLS